MNHDELVELAKRVKRSHPHKGRGWSALALTKHTRADRLFVLSYVNEEGDPASPKLATHEVVRGEDGVPLLESGTYHHQHEHGGDLNKALTEAVHVMRQRVGADG